jgi:hypothetical protein
VAPEGRSDRYEPLPGLLGIPAYLARKIPPRARRPAAFAAGLLLVALGVGVALAAPAIDESKRDRAAADLRASEQLKADRVARLRAEQRALRGEGTPARGLEGTAAVGARQALAADLAAAVERDARQRFAAGELKQPVEGSLCERYPRGASGEDPATDLSKPTGRYSCLAITARVEADRAGSPGVIGYPYRALVDFPSGRFTYCKVSGRPGEGSLRRELLVTVPRACGGGT